MPRQVDLGERVAHDLILNRSSLIVFFVRSLFGGLRPRRLQLPVSLSIWRALSCSGASESRWLATLPRRPCRSSLQGSPGPSSGSASLVVHFQSRISGMSSPYLADVLTVLDQLVAHGLLGVRGLAAELGQAIDHVPHQVEPVEVVHDGHVERRADRPFFLVAAHVHVLVVGAAVGQPVDQPRVAVVGEDDRLVLGEERVEVVVVKPMRVLASQAGAASGRRH